MNAKQKQTIALVNKAWRALPHLSGAGWGDGAETLFDVGLNDEKKHRKGAPDGYRHQTTCADAARLMCVYDLARSLKEAKPPQWRDFLSLRSSYLTAAALADINRAEILGAWEREAIGLESLAALDYSEFVSPERKG